MNLSPKGEAAGATESMPSSRTRRSRVSGPCPRKHLCLCRDWSFIRSRPLTHPSSQVHVARLPPAPFALQRSGQPLNLTHCPRSLAANRRSFTFYVANLSAPFWLPYRVTKAFSQVRFRKFDYQRRTWELRLFCRG